MLSVIADSLWFIVHLELDLYFLSPQGPLQVTLDSVYIIWQFLWHEIIRTRTQRRHPVSLPRLRTLKVKTSDSRGTRDKTATFEARLSERDDLAARGHAEVNFLPLQGLYEKYGHGKCENHFQENYRRDLTDRAVKGRPLDKELSWDSSTFPQARPLDTVLSTMADWETS